MTCNISFNLSKTHKNKLPWIKLRIFFFSSVARVTHEKGIRRNIGVDYNAMCFTTSYVWKRWKFREERFYLWRPRSHGNDYYTCLNDIVVYFYSYKNTFLNLLFGLKGKTKNLLLYLRFHSSSSSESFIINILPLTNVFPFFSSNSNPFTLPITISAPLDTAWSQSAFVSLYGCTCRKWFYITFITRSIHNLLYSKI